MDASGITVQVLSVAGPGADLVPGQEGIDLARAYNDALAEACARHPTATEASPTCRCSPRTRRRTNWNARSRTSASTACWSMAPPMAASSTIPRSSRSWLGRKQLDLPIYLHPGIPVQAVRASLLRRSAGQLQLHAGAVCLGLARRHRHPYAAPCCSVAPSTAIPA